MENFRSHMQSPLGDSASTRIANVFFAICKAQDTPTSLGLWLRFKYDEFEQLANFDLDPKGYHDSAVDFGHGAWQFQCDYLAASYLSKYKGLDTKINTRSVAIGKFELAESKCYLTNRRLRMKSVEATQRWAPVLYLAQRKIANILGDCDVTLDSCGWGPGSTFSLTRSRASLVDKLREKQISVTPSALFYAQRAVGLDIHWCQARGIPAEGPCTLLPSEFRVVEGNKVTTVPKNAKTDRVIAQEPTANIFLQKAFGKVIRQRLSKVGVNLNDQSHNQWLASIAFREGLTTVDLSAASDTISRELVYDLLPIGWASILDDLRSHNYLLNKEWKCYSKFSSMGNGFTFELESLIFYGLSHACCHFLGLPVEHLSVYGDDIVIPTAALELLMEVFEWCGFTINVSKTHANSLFRESCGKHYFGSVDVTPIYQKEVPDVQAEIYRLANRIRRYACHSSGLGVSLSIYRGAWLSALRKIGAAPLHFLPLGSQQDTGIVVSSEDVIHFQIPSMPLGSKSPQLVFQPIVKRVDNCALLAYWLRFHPDEPFEGRLSVGGRGKYVVRKRRNYAAQIDAPWV